VLAYRYQVESLHGRGTTSVVAKVIDTWTKRVCAIKIISNGRESATELPLLQHLTQNGAAQHHISMFVLNANSNNLTFFCKQLSFKARFVITAISACCLSIYPSICLIF